MKKQLILTAGIVLSACSSNGQNANQHHHQNGFNAPQNMAGQYQMAGYNAPQTMGGMNGMGGCAPASVPTPCQPVATPCAPAPVPTPCSKAGGVPWALGGAALGGGALMLWDKDKTPRPVPPFIKPPTGKPPVYHPVRPVKYLHEYKGEIRKHGLRSSYMQKKKAYKYADIGAVNYDASKKLGGVQARLGYQSANIIGAELEGSLGLIKRKNIDTNDIALGEKKLAGIDHSIAGFATARVPLGTSVKAVARVGYHSTKASYSEACRRKVRKSIPVRGTILTELPYTTYAECPDAETSSKTHNGVALGGGLEAELTTVDSIRADVTAYDMGDKFRKAVSVGYLRKF